MPYAQISAKLGIPIGSIGPTVSAAWPSGVGPAIAAVINTC